MLVKKLLLLILISTTVTTMAQPTNDYLKNWKKIEDLEKKGLTKTAKDEVTAIYKLAQKDNNDAQQIKACMYLIKYRNMVEEDSRENNIFYVDTLIAGAKVPAKNILQSMQAEMFWNYLQNNRWKFYDRTKLKEEKSKDVSTWSTDKIHSVMSGLYKSSLQNEAVLKSTKLEPYNAIIIKGQNTRQLRPTLFDFLAHRALSYFSTDENNLTKPAYQFKIDDEKVFAPAAEFTTANFKTKDTASLQYKAILLMQDILKFHLADAKQDALIDADLLRLSFVQQHTTLTNKVNLYEAALKTIEEKYTDNEAIAQAMYLRSKIYFDNGNDVNTVANSTNQYEIKRAKELCEAAIKKYPTSEGGINAQNLVNSIMQPSLQMETENVNPIDEPFRALVKYKNVPQVFFRVVKTSRDEIKKIDRRDYDKVWSNYVALKPIKTWSVAMPDPKDFKQHSTEIKVDALPSGVYFLLASLTEDFSLKQNIITKQIIYVSNISYINTDKQEYYVLHRNSGLPLANTAVQVWNNEYDYQTGNYQETKGEKYTTDKNGFFKMKDAKDYRNFLLQIKNNNDELFLGDNFGYNTYNTEEQRAKPATFLFTDRSIYRPGQTVYFKGIVLQTEKEAAKSAVVPNFSTKVILRNANYQKTADVKLITNEFGSFSGTFKLPEGVLNGNFSIYDSVTNGSANFSVEEYKRPKFFTEINKPKGSYRVNDSIKVIGIAKAYAGNNIDGAKVKYRVVRKVQYPIWWGYYYGRGGYAGRSEQMEITNGETTTDAKGEFKVIFKALPDETVDKKNQPTFYYEVSADVTDLNGETRSGSTSVAVSYQALQLNINSLDKLPADSLKTLVILSSNINGIYEKATVTASIHKVTAPNKIFRERFWQIPDQFVMSKQEYANYFPHDVYKDEDKISVWPVAERVFDKTDSTKENNQFAISNNKFSSGWYKIIATAKDKYGEDVKAEKYIELTASTTPSMEPLTMDVQKQTAEPGEQIKYSITTGFDNVWAIHLLNKMNSAPITTYQALLKNQSVVSAIPALETDRGGIAASIAFVKYNRVYTANKSFSIPWSNKELDVRFETFRDKLLPGAEEQFTIKISGLKGEKVAAEMLAAMYDASLDQFKPHYWNKPNVFPSLYGIVNWRENGFTAINSEEYNKRENNYIGGKEKSYDRLGVRNSKQEEEPLYWLNPLAYGYEMLKGTSQGVVLRGQAIMEAPMAADSNAELKEGIVVSRSKAKMDGNIVKKSEEILALGEKIKKAGENDAPPQIRKNFNETAFFFPDLKTDANGNVSFTATLPEALTQWKLMTLSHTKNLAFGNSSNTLITQKPLMVQPNAPRFLREGDKIEFSTKVVNLTDKEITGTIQLELFDAATNTPIDGWFKNMFANQYFTIAAGQSTAVKFPMEVPFKFNSAMTYRIVAKTTDASDGEEMALPILTNRMLVTESLPLNLRNQITKTFKFDKLLNSGNSTTISNHALTVEYTSNPAWYAVQALPYLIEYPYECAEQTFNRYYANTLATYISNSMPKIKQVFEKWKNLDTTALQSNLDKNEELKYALLQETPWVLDAQNENKQKKNIALLLDMVKMSREQAKALNTLKQMQSSNGGFVWFKGGPDDRYITQYIITGIGHLLKLKALSNDNNNEAIAMAKRALPYLDKKIKEDYDWLIKNKTKLTQNNLSNTAIQYLYMRSFFADNKIAAASQTAVTYYAGQAKKYWLQNSKYMQAMIALALHRSNDEVTPKAIIKSLKENAIVKEELGMYWKEFTTGGYYWHQAPIESQAMMIEAFSDIDKNNATVDDLKTWLLKQKQTQNWKTTKATAEACYALLLNGYNWLANENEVAIKLGNTNIKSTDDKTQAGNGYFKKRFDAKDVKPAMGNISVSLSSTTSTPLNQVATSWGSVYWQYFEDLDKITSAETPLKFKKQLYVERNTDRGPTLTALADGAEIKVGDKIKVRIELKVDRDMEYVHMKDLRAACMEPVNVLSGYKYQGGLGYYESTEDASTNFFFSYLNRGTYVFEYPLFVTHAGNFSNGVTTIQCMYAPEFTAHSEGVRVSVE
jgi:uncharacterized protein YfaS (alpha-2-macroglobulin family)